MKQPLIQIFMMQPPKKYDDDDEEESMLAQMLKMSMEMNKSIKNLPHAEHTGGG